MLRRGPAKPWLRRQERPDQHIGVPGGRLGGQGQRQDRRFSFAPGGSPGYDRDLRSDKWEIPVGSTYGSDKGRLLGVSSLLRWLNIRSARRHLLTGILCLLVGTIHPMAGCAGRNGAFRQESFTNSLGMKMIYIPPGSFTMGSPNSEKGRYRGEAQHNVTISKPFYMSACEVTQEQYEAVMGVNPSERKGENLPVESVNWVDAVDFCARLSVIEGQPYRLPTEAKWEYACRAGSSSAYCFGNSQVRLHVYAHYNRFLGKSICLYHHEFKDTPLLGDLIGIRSVGKKKPNVWGLYDMHGNVWEWCYDWYGPYGTDPEADPTGPASGTGRVLRGGCWANPARSCRCAHRIGFGPHNRGVGNIGLRVVAEPRSAPGE